MVESVAHRKLIGNAYLARELATRDPSFLRRNLRQALDGHARRLAALRSRQSGDLGLLDAMTATDLREAGWNYPTKSMLEDLLKGHKPVLRILGMQLRDRDADRAAKKTAAAREVSPRKPKTDDPDWLPNASVDFHTSCKVTARVMRPGYPGSEIYVETKAGTVESSATESPRRFDITLEKPLLIEVDKLYVTIDTGTTGNNRWKRTVPLEYELRIEIKCQDLAGTIDFLELLESKPLSPERTSFLDVEGVLKLKWQSFPECPPANRLLPLKRAQGHKSLLLAYGAEVSMGWLRQQDTALERYNRHLRDFKIKTNQLPTPVTSDQMEITPPEHVITYVYEQAQHVCKHLRCPLCAVPGTPGVAYPDFHRLHMHLHLYHDHFHFEIEHSKETPALVEKTIVLSVSERGRDILRQPSPGEEETWIAPARPFDEQAYLTGQDTWTGHQQPQKRTAKSTKTNGLRSANASPSKPSKPAITSQRQMNGVAPTPQTAKLHPIPEVPGVRFYALSSKRPLTPGTLLPSPNASTLDLTWLKQRLHDDINHLPITCTDDTKAFWKAWNAHLESENLCGETYMAGCLERYKQKWPAEMAGCWRDDFNELVKRLAQHKIIAADALDALISSTADQRIYGMNAHGAKTLTNGTPTSGTLTNGHVSDTPLTSKPLANGHEPEPAAPKPPTQTCICGQVVTSNRGVIICDDSRCKRIWFHLECVRLDTREDGWRCAECCKGEGAGCKSM